jgi:hypothetical protein
MNSACVGRLAALREPKTLGGEGEEAGRAAERDCGAERLRQELPPAHPDGPAAVQKLEQEAEAQRRDQAPAG